MEYKEIDGIVFYHGASIACVINGSQISSAKVSVKDTSAHICQDIEDGGVSSETFGYKYSWAISCGLSGNAVTDVIFKHDAKIINGKLDIDDGSRKEHNLSLEFLSVTIGDYTFNHKERFIANLHDQVLNGIVSLDGVNAAYLCQDVLEGHAPNDLFGYKYGWALEYNNVLDIKSIEFPDRIKYKKGDFVLLKNKRGHGWNSSVEMDEYIGKLVQIKSINGTLFGIENDGNYWNFRIDDIERMEHINTKNTTAAIKENSDGLLKESIYSISKRYSAQSKQKHSIKSIPSIMVKQRTKINKKRTRPIPRV